MDATEELSSIPDRANMEEGAKGSILTYGTPGSASQDYKTLSVSTVAVPTEENGLSRIITMLIYFWGHFRHDQQWMQTTTLVLGVGLRGRALG